MSLGTALISLAAGLIYNIAITRKLPSAGLGLLTLLTASTAFSLLPNAVLSFALPRIAARDSGLNLRAALGVSSLFFAGSAALTAGYLALTWDKMGPDAPLVLAAALATELVNYVLGAASSVLLVKDRGRFVFSSLAQAAAKIAAIPVIEAFKWSVAAVLWSSVAVTAVPAAYSLSRAARYAAPGSFLKYLREVANAAWVPLMGYAVNSFRALDATVIGIFGALEEVGLWYVLFMLSKPYVFSGLLSNITYGELLERGRSGVYRDLLMVLYTATAISLSYIFFEPLFVNFLRPRDPQYAAPLLAPIALWAAGNVLGALNQFLGNIMQGVDKRDIAAGEIKARAYLGSLVLYAHLAELVFTAIYLASMVPLIYLFRRAGVELYAIMGVVASSFLANAAAFAFRFTKAGGRVWPLIGGPLARDYLAPTLAASAALYAASSVVRFPLVPSVYVSLAEVAAAVVLTAGIYLAASLAISRTSRELFALAARSASRLLRDIT